jgi:hypothetical protein
LISALVNSDEQYTKILILSFVRLRYFTEGNI